MNELASTGKVKVGFIGLGVMGKSMARNLMKAGYDLYVYSRTKSKSEDLLQEGAIWKEGAADVARHADVTITMVEYPSDVENIFLGPSGIVAAAKPGSYLIDMTTSSPALAARIYEESRKKGLQSLDAPVSGGDIGARDGKLSIMVGGDEEAFEAVLPVFQAMGTNIVYQGAAGAGQHTKMCNQIAIAANMMGVSEALVYAERSGLNPARVLKSIETGAAGSWSLSNLAPRIIQGNYEPGFYVKHMIKDLGIALQSAEAMGLEAYGLSLAKTLYEKLAAAGEESSGTQALVKIYR
ncbi:NAD(P)-dependent oxidoreductase [Paenibacillus chondroitinus]|uniref:NAD(P)-dependent oxidoreductase n=1 Tax=Paenibacillus chondroitinus TaxID=59842 RepID=A0ABU6D6G5_9BACL|nr:MULTISPECIES: NAD(P)-dependent oxidoreductase [Paenibacillus]MCY9660105.1 NAD(P)-dependent oxidoreductase [Paenibacillus anseongense]MEB4793036.1 NAD(P)-dependent oxidoreductase [Paenibacillus chondroitinus]